VRRGKRICRVQNPEGGERPGEGWTYQRRSLACKGGGGRQKYEATYFSGHLEQKNRGGREEKKEKKGGGGGRTSKVISLVVPHHQEGKKKGEKKERLTQDKCPF